MALIFGAILFLVSGFFVARFPVKPELAWVSSVFVLLMALPSYVALCRWLGFKRGVLGLLALAIYAVGVEYFAVKTGVPYGEFSYGAKIGHPLWNAVPWTVPFAWSPLVLASYALASRRMKREYSRLLVSALILVAIDLVLDPGAVAQGFWLYSRAGTLGFWPLNVRFYDVPVSNFLGWMISGFFATLVFQKTLPQEKQTEIPPRGLMQSTFLVLCFWTSATFWMNLFGPCFVGVVLLAVFVKTLFFDSTSTDSTSTDSTSTDSSSSA